MTLRQYAKSEGITMQAAYLRVWNGRVPGAERVNGRWIIATDSAENTQPPTMERAEVRAAV